MQANISTRKKSARTCREDGDLTKKRILETAGHLFADKGYANTTCKEICEQAKTNIAAVNYHFGGRDGLYADVLEEVKQLASQPLLEIAESNDSPREKIGRFVDSMVAAIFDHESWRVRLWAREVAAPTPIRPEAESERWMARFRVMTRLVEAYTGIPVDHPLMAYSELAMMSPFMFLLIVGPHRGPHQEVFRCGKEAAAESLKVYVLAGLDAMAAKYAAAKESTESAE